VVTQPPPVNPPVDPPPVVTPPPVITPPPITNFPPVDGTKLLPYVQFQGSPDNTGEFVTQARVDVSQGDIVAPFFMVGFFLARDSHFGMLCAYGNQGDPDKGLISLTLQGTMVRLFEWWFPAPGGWAVLADVDGAFNVNAWQHACMVIQDGNTRDLIVGGTRQPQSGQQGAPFPIPETNGVGLAVTFGSYKTVTPGILNVERHSLDGGLRDWALVRGVPTDAEITRHAGGENASSIWGSRVWDAWSFTHDPALGPEPGINGHNLTWIDGGISAGHHLPTLVTS
jgi:hypothetical protein